MIKEYQEFTTTTNIYGKSISKLSETTKEKCLNGLILSQGLNEEAGEVAAVFKKMVRDDGGILNAEKKDKLEKELGDCLWYISEICNWAGFDLEYVLLQNKVKLSSRYERGVIGGSGDDR